MYCKFVKRSAETVTSVAFYSSSEYENETINILVLICAKSFVSRQVIIMGKELNRSNVLIKSCAGKI